MGKSKQIVVRDDSVFMEKPMHIGIAGIGLYFPSAELSAADLAAETGVPEDVIALKFGIKRKPVAGPEDTTADMGYKAAMKALEEAGVQAGDVDLVIWCGAQHKDYPCWLAGLNVAEQARRQQHLQLRHGSHVRLHDVGDGRRQVPHAHARGARYRPPRFGLPQQ